MKGYDDITRRKAAGQRISTEELELMADRQEQDRVDAEREGKPQLGDYRLTVVRLRTDHRYNRTVHRLRVVVETWSFKAQTWVALEAGGVMNHTIAQEYAVNTAKHNLRWKGEVEIAAMKDERDRLSATKLTAMVEREPGVWEFATETVGTD